MTERRLALNNKGDMTYCSSSNENIGRGRCNHVIHQRDGENAMEFIARVNEYSEKESDIDVFVEMTGVDISESNRNWLVENMSLNALKTEDNIFMSIQDGVPVVKVGRNIKGELLAKAVEEKDLMDMIKYIE